MITQGHMCFSDQNARTPDTKRRYAGTMHNADPSKVGISREHTVQVPTSLLPWGSMH